MVEKQVNICDVCSNAIADEKCKFCKKDVCEKCSTEQEIGTIQAIVCKSCNDALDKIMDNNGSFWEELNNQLGLEEKITRYVHKSMIVGSLEKSDNEKDSDITSGLKKLKRHLTKRKIKRRVGGFKVI